MKFPIRPINVKFHFKKKHAHVDKIYIVDERVQDVRNNKPQDSEDKKH